MKCPQCGLDVETGAKFCPECGVSMPTVMICPKCHCQCSLTAKFCVECGTRLNGSIIATQEGVDWSGQQIMRTSGSQHMEGGNLRTGDGCYLQLPAGVRMEMIYCSPGKFVMGCSAEESGEDEEDHDYNRQHNVTLTNGFWLGKYPVTQKQWQTVMGYNPSKFKGDDLPVERVSWEDSQKFINAVNKLLNCGARLPTEAEWEYACRAGTTTAYSWGNSLNGDKANCDGSSPFGTSIKGRYIGKTTPIGKYGANPWGFFDMHGNVLEWCSDWYDEYPAGSVTNPVGPISSPCGRRVVRGGSWYPSDCHGAYCCRSAYRDCLNPDCRSRGDEGVRICCSTNA